MPRVSVVIPCFNLGRYLDEAVSSVLAQTETDTEIIVINPGSTDPFTARLLASYERPRTRVIATPYAGVCESRNLGVREARSPYVCCLDSDDVLEPACLEKTCRVLDADPGVGFVSFWYRMFGDSDGIVAQEGCTLVDFLLDNAVCAASVFRKAAWERCGGYDEALTSGFEDWDFWLNILTHGYRAEIVPEYLFRYRIRADARHNTCDTAEQRKILYRMLMRKYEKEFRRHAMELVARKDDLFGWCRENHIYLCREHARTVLELAEARRALAPRLHIPLRRAYRALAAAPYRAAVRLVPRAAKAAVPVPLINCARRLLGGAGGPPLFRQAPWDGPLASVVIPCYNYGSFLDEALGSVLSQTLEGIETIVIDDGSDDALTLERLAGIERRRIPGVRLIRQGNQGVCRARNNAIRAARGKYICCLDADDLLEPTYIEKCAAAMESEGLDICYGWVRIFGMKNRIWRTDAFDAAGLVVANRVPAAAVFTRAIWEAAGGYNPNMERGNEDWDFWLSIAGAGGRGKVIPEALFRYRLHEQGRDAAALARAEELMARMRLNHPGLFAGRFPRQRPGRFAIDPFVNLAPAGLHALPAAGRELIVCGTAGPEAARLARERVHAGSEVHLIALGAPPGASEALGIPPDARYVFLLSSFLEERFRAPFVLDYVGRRGIGEVLFAEPIPALEAAIRKRHPRVSMRRAE
jgi:glycosyltransferase involved in cell wall biosynthesis